MQLSTRAPLLYRNSPMVDLDLVPVMAKLCHPTKGLGWTIERAQRGVEFYRRWLWLFTQRVPEQHLSPPPDVDSVWHMHILDTRKYAEDCNLMFGHMLHHNPFSGWESEEAEAEHQKIYRQTCEMYFRFFGNHLEGENGICDGGCFGVCEGAGCHADFKLASEIWRPTAILQQQPM